MTADLKMKFNKTTLLIPMVGEGSRFKQAGYSTPKPFLDMAGIPMVVEVVRDCLYAFPGIDVCVFVCRTADKQRLLEWTRKPGAFPDGLKFEFVTVDQTTQGALCTALLAKEHINSAKSLVIANSDQSFSMNANNFQALVADGGWDGAPLLFTDGNSIGDNPHKWSWATLSRRGMVQSVVEKPNTIPERAFPTCGVYWFRAGDDFVDAAEILVRHNIRSGPNNEFYLAPVYNQLTSVMPYFVDSFYGLGTPEDFERYMEACGIEVIK